MADTKAYTEGDSYEIKYPDAPRPPEKRHKIGGQLAIRGERNQLLALWEVEETDENGAKGKVIRVFQTKIPTTPLTDPRQTGPAANQRKKPL